jgi:hypothetical protein
MWPFQMDLISGISGEKVASSEFQVSSSKFQVELKGTLDYFFRVVWKLETWNLKLESSIPS